MNQEQKDMIEWFLDYQKNHSGTHSGRAMMTAMTAIIATGACHPVVIGALDLENIEKFLAILGDREVMRGIAKSVHWGRDPY